MTNEDNIKLCDTWYLEFLLEKIQKELERRKNKKTLDKSSKL